MVNFIAGRESWVSPAPQDQKNQQDLQLRKGEYMYITIGFIEFIIHASIIPAQMVPGFFS